MGCLTYRMNHADKEIKCHCGVWKCPDCDEHYFDRYNTHVGYICKCGYFTKFKNNLESHRRLGHIFDK
jgi:hypothetical protein